MLQLMPTKAIFHWREDNVSVINKNLIVCTLSLQTMDCECNVQSWLLGSEIK
jgi:hypothetical protein